MSRQDRVGSHKTRVFTEKGVTKVRYHETDVVSFDDEKIILNSGGWNTNTTRDRMNQASNQFDLRYGVSRRSDQLFTDFGGFVRLPFVKDILVLNRLEGRPILDQPPETVVWDSLGGTPVLAEERKRLFPAKKSSPKTLFWLGGVGFPLPEHLSSIEDLSESPHYERHVLNFQNHMVMVLTFKPLTYEGRAELFRVQISGPHNLDHSKPWLKTWDQVVTLMNVVGAME